MPKEIRELSEIVTEVSLVSNVLELITFSATYKRAGFTSVPDNIEYSMPQHGDTQPQVTNGEKPCWHQGQHNWLRVWLKRVYSRMECVHGVFVEVLQRQ
jgi:hypothetical protein